MPVIVACRCGKRFRAIDSLAGKQVNCPGCGRPLLIPRANVAGDSLLDELPSAGGVLESGHSYGLPSAPPYRHRSAEKLEGWVLALVVLGGGITVLAVVGVLVSLFWPGSGQGPEAEIAAQTPATATDQEGGKPAGEEPESVAEEDPLIAEAPQLQASSVPPPATASRETTPDESPEPSARDDSPSQPENPPAKPSRDRPAPKKPKATGPASRPAEPIRLSAGVALAQTLPTGTAMGFSVDYEFTDGAPNPSDQYLWVIEPAKGQPVGQPVRLEQRGTLQGFVPQLRPENGPFQTHLQDYQGTRLSRSLSLR